MPQQPALTPTRIAEVLERTPTSSFVGGRFLGGTAALEVIRKELDVTMALCGHRDIRNVGRDVLVPGTYPEADPAPFLRHAAAPGTT